MTTEQPERERMTEEEMDEVVSNLREIPVFGTLDTEDRDAAINLITQLRTQLTLAEQQRDAAVEGLWKPASEHSDEFEDGDAYLVRIPVIDHRHNREYMEYYIIRASCDSETPLTWNDQHGDHWCEWDWEDVEAYIKLNTLTRIREMGEKEVSHD
jgi:hypothetical protein